MNIQRAKGGVLAAFATITLLLIASATAADNLLANPGFEDLAGDTPSRWDKFVQPKPGAVAALSDLPHAGSFAVQLHIPTPYDKDPVNNWSQNIIGDFGGTTLHISGFIRVEDAKEAAIWLQLWRKKPWGVMGAASTSVDMPVYGTEDWQEVSMEVPVPEGVDFVTLRCVLLGSGTAWFDDISVTRVESDITAAESPDAAGNQTAKEEPPLSKSPLVVPPSGPKPESPAPMEAQEPAPADPDILSQEKVLPLVGQLEAEMHRLRDANAILTDTLEEIQSVNQALLKEMLSVQAELKAMKEEKENAGAPPLKSPNRRVPPLVPLSESQEFNAP